MKRLSAPVLLGLLLFATLVGAAGAWPNAVPPSAVVKKTVWVHAADCVPWNHEQEYMNAGYYIRGLTGAVAYVCPVHFPEYGTHRILSITMYVYDNEDGAAYKVEAEATRTRPVYGDETIMGVVSSSGKSTKDPRTFTISGAKISPKIVTPSMGMYFWVSMQSSSKLVMYAIRVQYTMV